MERGNKKVLKEFSLPLGPVPLGKEQMSAASKCMAKAEGNHKVQTQLVPKERTRYRPKHDMQNAQRV